MPNRLHAIITYTEYVEQLKGTQRALLTDIGNDAGNADDT